MRNDAVFHLHCLQKRLSHFYFVQLSKDQLERYPPHLQKVEGRMLDVQTRRNRVSNSACRNIAANLPPISPNLPLLKPPYRIRRAATSAHCHATRWLGCGSFLVWRSPVGHAGSASNFPTLVSVDHAV